jgi:hypothetical protein
LFGTCIIKEAERQVQIIREDLRTAQSRQKSYVEGQRRDMVFQDGDYVYLKVSLIRGLWRFKVKGKLSPRFIGPFKILERVGEVDTDWSYQISSQMCMMCFISLS